MCKMHQRSLQEPLRLPGSVYNHRQEIYTRFPYTCRPTQCTFPNRSCRCGLWWNDWKPPTSRYLEVRHAKKGVCGRFKKFKSELNQIVALYQLRSSSGQLCRVKPREEAEVVGMVGFNIVKHQNIFTHVHTHRDRCCGHTKQEGEGGMEDQIERGVWEWNPNVPTCFFNRSHHHRSAAMNGLKTVSVEQSWIFSIRS